VGYDWKLERVSAGSTALGASEIVSQATGIAVLALTHGRLTVVARDEVPAGANTLGRPQR